MKKVPYEKIVKAAKERLIRNATVFRRPSGIRRKPRDPEVYAVMREMFRIHLDKYPPRILPGRRIVLPFYSGSNPVVEEESFVPHDFKESDPNQSLPEECGEAYGPMFASLAKKQR